MIRAMAAVACVGFLLLQALLVVQCRENLPSDLRDPLYADGAQLGSGVYYFHRGYWTAMLNHGLLSVRAATH